MKVLSRAFLAAQTRKDIKGIALAQGMPALMHIMYADVLVILGRAEEIELDKLRHIMGCGEILRPRINNEKSVI
jgi:hypothetical protein